MELRPPFVATPVETVKLLIDILADSKDKKIVDLGSGDGRIVVELARKGFVVDGFETDEKLVARSRERIADLHIEQYAHIYPTDYWNNSLHKYSVVYIYGIPAIMGKLEEKLGEELQPGSIVISNVYRFPNWKPKKTIGTLHIYLVY